MLSMESLTQSFALQDFAGVIIDNNNIGVIVGAAFSYKCDRVSAIGFDTKTCQLEENHVMIRDFQSEWCEE